MASVKKMNISKSKKKKKNPVPADESNKNIARILVGIVLIVCIIESMNLFRSQPVKIKSREILSVNGSDSPCGPFVAWGIAPIGTDKFVVADNDHDRLIEFNRQGTFLKAWGQPGNKIDDFHEPSGMTYDNNGNVYVADTWNSMIKGYDANGKRVLDLDLTKYGGFFGPRGIGFDGNNIVIADTGSHRIVLIGLDGTLVAKWGHYGSDPGDFKGPLDVISDQKGNYFVADSDNGRVQWLNKDGQVIDIIKDLPGVKALALDNQGRLYASSDVDGGSIEVYRLGASKSWFSSKAQLVGDLTDQNGSENPFRNVRGMAITSDNVLMITADTTVSLYQLLPPNPS